MIISEIATIAAIGNFEQKVLFELV